MYKFADVNEASESILPSEALKINGEYIENLISGYRTLNVKGREALSPDVYSFETGVRDGSRLKYKRYPERIITVTYQIIAKTNEEFREAYNKLGGILNVTDAELIFNDETDKYFIGTPCIIGDVSAGSNAVVGDFEILCTDPFKYSVVEYEATPLLDEGSILIDYNGTYKSYPTLEADFYDEKEDGVNETTLTGLGDCGYVAFFNESEKIIQLGNPDEKDGEAGAYAASQTLMNQTFLSNTAWGTTAKKLWALNSGLIPATVTKEGTVTMAVAAYGDAVKETSGTLVNATSKASSPTINYTVKAKATDRKQNSVKVTATITGSLGSSGSYFLTGYGLKASLYIGGAWHDITLKSTSDQWRGKTAHTKNLVIIVTGISESANALTDIKFRVTRTDTLGTAGALSSVSCNDLKIATYIESVAEKYYITASNFGSSSGWHGPSITRTLGADAAGEVGAKNFTLTYKQKMCIGNGTNDTKQLGGFHCHLYDDSGNNVAGVRIVKTTAGKSASLMLFVNGVKVHQVGIDISYYNKYFGSSVKSVQTSTIKKVGNKIYFTIGGYSKTFTDDAITDLAVNKVTFMFEKNGTNTPLSYNGLFTAKFVKNNCTTLKDIPNKFSAGDILTADCKEGEIYLNNISSPELGALGNDWEDFYLTPGLNQIGFSYSDWIEAGYEPKIKVRYREVFL